MIINKDSIIGDILDNHAELAGVFLDIGMHCLGCPASRGETIAEACEVHGENCEELIKKLNGMIGGK